MRYCLRRSLKLQEIVEACKAALIDVAEEEIREQGDRYTVNRLSIITGLHRADVTRLVSDEQPGIRTGNVIVRLISQWQTDNRFLTSAGKPRVLTFDGKVGEFAKLVNSVSGDPNPYSLLGELERLDIVERSARGVRLKTKEYIVRSDPKKSFEHLSCDSEDLIRAVEENVYTAQNEPNLHLRTEYDRVSAEQIPLIRRWLLREGSAFHARARKFLSRLDLDTNKRLKDSGSYRTVTICSFSRTSLSTPRVETGKSPAKVNKGQES